MAHAANHNREVCMMARTTHVLEPFSIKRIMSIASITLSPPDDLPAFPPEPPGQTPPPGFPPEDPDDDTPETPPTEPPPMPVQDPPVQPDPPPMVVDTAM
jgi:hypothetical protein